MTDNYIKKILVNYSRNVTDLEIPLSEASRQHLILTGKNGSGKTSLLLALYEHLSKVESESFRVNENLIYFISHYKNILANPDTTEEKKAEMLKSLEVVKRQLEEVNKIQIEFSNPIESISNKLNEGEFILLFFDAKRQMKLNIPSGIKKVQLQKKYPPGEKANAHFIQYIVNLKADRSFARDDGQLEVVAQIDAWFQRLENRLKSIFNVDTLELEFDRQSYNFYINTNKGERFTFDTLSDGYSAIISIVTELLLRMEAHRVKSYDLEGIVIIDEIETHLHVDLQKKILPFLADFFPKIQFIVSTHSPFVLSSLSNATICDLETRTITSDLSGYSYDALIESYFKSDKYSETLKLKMSEFEYLLSLRERTDEQNEHLRFLRNYFAHLPKYLSTELLVKLQQLKLSEIKANR